MLNKYILPLLRTSLSLICMWSLVLTSPVFGQAAKGSHVNHHHYDPAVMKSYEAKARHLLTSSGMDLKTILISAAGNTKNTNDFKKFLGPELSYDKRELILLVGEGKVNSEKELRVFLDTKKEKYVSLYRKFIEENNKDQKTSIPRNPNTFMPGRGPGQPCQNMDFESQTLTAWGGSYGSSCDPSDIAGFNNLGINSGTGQHTIMTGGNDPNIGAAIPCVMPGGTASLRLGDNGGGGNWAARISQTFQVQPANPYFTYNYAVVLEDAGHTLAEQPYFRIRMYDGGGGLIACATLDVDATNAPGLITTAGMKYKGWTQVVIPLTAYVGQNVTIEFTTADCNNGAPDGGAHDGYAYIDCSCVPPQIFTSSPSICGGTSINVTAPSGLSSYSWSGPGIVGANNTQTISVNAAGTYTVTMQTNTTPPNIPCTFSLDTIIPGNPLNPTAQFISNVVCQGGSTVFTDQSTPLGGINSWAWDFDNNGTTDAAIQNPAHVFPAAGTFPVTLTVTSGPCTDNFTANVTVNPGVAPVINPAGPFCTTAAPVTLTANIAGGTWSGTGITDAATGAFDPALAAIGNNVISYTTVGACGGTSSATILVNAVPVSDAGADVNICSGVAASVGTPATAGYTYSWSPATGLSAANISDPSITTVNGGAAPIVTTYTVTTTASGCSSTDVTQVTVNPLPVLTITNPPAVCSPSAVDITVAAVTAGSTGGGTLTYWTDAAGTIPLAGPTGVALSGTYYIKTTAVGGCTDIEPVVVTINPLPGSDAGTDVVICSGDAAAIGAPPVAGNSYSWSPATGLSASNISNPSITTVNGGVAPIVTSYTVTTSALGCSTTDVVQVTVNPLPVLMVTDPAGICTPGTVDITVAAVTAGSTGGGTFNYWTDAAGTIPLAGPTGIAVSGTYYIKVTAAGGCTDIGLVVVTINPLPVSNAGTDVTICSGTAASIGAAPVAGNNYSWLPAAGLSATNVANPNITTLNAGTVPIVTSYTVTTTVAATGCSTTDEVTVTVNPQPVLTITDPAAVCTPDIVDITAPSVTAGSTGGGVLSYWTDAAATVSLSSPSAVTASGTYYIKVTAAGGCTDIEPVIVIVNPLPVSDAGTDVTICTGTSATIGAAATAGYDYAWLPATGLSAYNVSNPSNTTVNGGTTAIVTTYTVTTTVAATGCQSLDSVTVTVNPFPVITTNDPAPVCAPNTIDLTAPAVIAGTVGSGTYSYWTDAAGTVALSSPSAVNASGTYYIQLVSGAGCSDIEPVVVTINPLPVSNAGADLTICTGSSGPIGAAATAGMNYLWVPSTGLSSDTDPNPTVTLTNITLSPVSTTYTVTTTNSVTGCVTSDSVVVTVNPVATANAGSSQSVCVGTGITLAGAVGGAATGGTWSGGLGTFAPDNATLNAVYTPSAAEYAAGSVTLTLTSNDPAGPCTFASSNVTFFFYQNPVVDFTVTDPSGCPVHCASLTNTSTVAAGETIAAWEWDFGDGSPDSTSLNSVNQNTSHCYNVTGFYDVTLTITSSNGCTASYTEVHAVEVYPVPVAEFTVTPNPASVLDPEVTFNNGSSPDVIYWTYYFGDGDSITPFESNPVHMYPNSGPATYQPVLMVENAVGCRDTITHPLEVGPEFTFFIPNAFTPNGDGVNDYFFGQGIGIAKYDIWIFDRWGNMIYHGDHIDSSQWDGKANHGKEVAQQDVYVWKVKLTDVFGKKHNYIGTVTLVK
jgi:gliding motility-associated-like protein